MDLSSLFMPVLILGGATIALVVAVRMIAGIGLVVMEHERGLLFIAGQFRRVLAPGSHLVMHPWRHLERIDIRSQVMSVPGQEVLTRDGLAFKLSALIQFRIERPEVAFLSCASITQHLHAETQLALRAFVGSRDSDTVMSEREQLNEALSKSLEATCATHGLKLEQAGLKDLMLPAPVRQVLQQVVEARKGAEASLERARGETAVLRHLANAARSMESNQALLALKALHTASDGKHTLVLNLPSVEGPPPANAVVAS